MKVFAGLRMLKREWAAVYDACERTDAVSWSMSTVLDCRDEGLLSLSLPGVAAMSSDVPYLGRKFCLAKFSSLRRWPDSDTDCAYFCSHLRGRSSSELVNCWRAVEGSWRSSGGVELTAEVLEERTAHNRVFFRVGTTFLFFCTPLEWFSISY